MVDFATATTHIIVVKLCAGQNLLLSRRKEKALTYEAAVVDEAVQWPFDSYPVAFFGEDHPGGIRYVIARCIAWTWTQLMRPVP